MLANVAVNIRPTRSSKVSEAGNLMVASAEVTIPQIGTIRDIVIQQTPTGELRCYGPSRPAAKPTDVHRFYNVVILASELRDLILLRYRLSLRESDAKGVGA